MPEVPNHMTLNPKVVNVKPSTLTHSSNTKYLQAGHEIDAHLVFVRNFLDQRDLSVAVDWFRV